MFDTTLLEDVNAARLRLIAAKEKHFEASKGLEVYHNQQPKRDAWIDVQICREDYENKIRMYQQDLHEQAASLLPTFLLEKFQQVVPVSPTGQCIIVEPDGFTYFT